MPSFPYMLGWRQDLEKDDPRDYHIDHSEMQKVFKAQPLVNERITGAVEAPNVHSLRKWCSPIEDQGQLGSCTANAAVGMFETMMNLALGTYIRLSRLFVYKATREIMFSTGDSGATLRATMESLVNPGTPPELYWPYTDQQPAFDNTPSWIASALAGKYCVSHYFRLDPGSDAGNDDKQKVLSDAKASIFSGIPWIFGTPVWPSIANVGISGIIPLPDSNPPEGGHALTAIGYDDTKVIPGASGPGAFEIRNSWGTGWGDGGYGWLSYDYLQKRYMSDMWAAQRVSWINMGDFT